MLLGCSSKTCLSDMQEWPHILHNSPWTFSLRHEPNILAPHILCELCRRITQFVITHAISFKLVTIFDQLAQAFDLFSVFFHDVQVLV
jgi:hypothetical protein